MKRYKVTIEFTSFFEKTIEATDEDQADEIAFKCFEMNAVAPRCPDHTLMHTEFDICEITEIKE